MSAGGGDKKSGMQKSANPIEAVQTRTEIAKLAGVSHDTIKKVAVIQKEASPEQLERARKGGVSNLTLPVAGGAANLRQGYPQK